MSQKKRQLNLREQGNPSCLKCSTRAEKEQQREEGLCKTASSVMDGLSVRCVREWARNKIHYLNRYLAIFARAMKDRWAGLNYVEICSGPGRCILSKTASEMDGTALSVLNNPVQEYLKEALFIDFDENVISALNKRIAALGTKVKARAVRGNYKNTEEMRALLTALSAGHLNLVFIDPTECDVPFETIIQIEKTLKNADLIITVFMGTDVGRNIRDAVLKSSHGKSRLKYEGFLGNASFFDDADVRLAAQEDRNDDLKQKFISVYRKNLEALGYVYVDMSIQVKHYYWILFASKHKRGLEFWKQACKYTPEDQQEFPF